MKNQYKLKLANEIKKLSDQIIKTLKTVGLRYQNQTYYWTQNIS